MILLTFLSHGTSRFSLCNRHFYRYANRYFLITPSDFQLITIYQKLANQSSLSKIFDEAVNYAESVRMAVLNC